MKQTLEAPVPLLSTLRVYLPVILLAGYMAAFMILSPEVDYTHTFLPVGHIVLGQADPYAFNEMRTFIYLPTSLWFFELLPLVPYSYQLFLCLSAFALYRSVRALNASLWWVLYPPALYVLMLGQLDLLLLWGGVEAYRRRHAWWSPVLLAILFLIKPQTALFWILPCILIANPLACFAAPDKRISFNSLIDWRYLGYLGSLIAMPTIMSMANAPMLWESWLSWEHIHRAYYQNISASFWSLGIPVLGILSLAVWALAGKSPDARPFLALGFPSMANYGILALIGAAPVVMVAISYVLWGWMFITRMPVFFLEPIIMLLLLGIQYWRRDNSMRTMALSLLNAVSGRSRRFAEPP